MSRVGEKYNETFRGWHQMQRADTTPFKGNGSIMNSSFEIVVNITSTS